MTIATLDYPKAKLTIEVTNSVEASYRLKAASKEPWTVALIEAMPPGALFWDIGANVGPYSLIAASRNLAVVAIEPGFNSYAALCRNLARNNALGTTLALCLALGDKTRFDWLHYTDLRSGAASHRLGGTRKSTFQSQIIPVWAWDELAPRLPLVEGSPQYAKIDADGTELAILQGGPKVVAGLQGLVVEMRLPQEAEITALLKAAGLHITERYTQRQGKDGVEEMPGIAYGVFKRG